MSNDTEEPEKGAAPADGARKKKKKMVIIGAAAGLLLIGGGGGAYMFLGAKPAAAEAHAEEAAAEPEAEHGEEGEAKEAELPLDVPPVLVNLRTTDGAPHFLKVHVMLVPGSKTNLEDLRKKLPVLLDAYQPFLRELRPEDLSGSAAVYRIKEELMLRSADALGPDQVKDVLVQDLVQQ